MLKGRRVGLCSNLIPILAARRPKEILSKLARTGIDKKKRERERKKKAKSEEKVRYRRDQKFECICMQKFRPRAVTRCRADVVVKYSFPVACVSG